MEKFSFTTRLLHWSIAAFLLIQIPLAWYMIDLPLGPDKFAKYALHKSFGTVLFTLAVGLYPSWLIDLADTVTLVR